MTSTFPVKLNKSGQIIQASPGACLSHVLRENGIELYMPCGGRGTCGKCRVKVAGTVNPLTSMEEVKLNGEEREQGVRLACQVVVEGPVAVELPQGLSQTILEQGEMPDTEFAPLWRIERIDLTDASRIAEIKKELQEKSGPWLERWENATVQFERIDVETFDDRIIDFGGPGSISQKFGVAVDLGTTTLAAYLVDLTDGTIRATASRYNPQASYGADLITRIEYARSEAGLARLHEALVDAVNELLTELTANASVQPRQIIQVHLAGNAVMTHLFVNVSPESLGVSPYQPVFTETVRLTAMDAKMNSHPEGIVVVLPGIGGFVGSDITAGVFACEMNPDKAELFIDIGTNGEIVLAANGRMVACSTAAGPAFEGANIECGMLARSGAVVDVVWDGNTAKVSTIDNTEPKGICGTGLIRLLVELLKRGSMDVTGKLIDGGDGFYHQEQQRFYLTPGGSGVYLSQSDVRQLQVAKAAIRAGIEILCRELAVQPGQLERVYLAGAFGNYLRPEDAVALGLLPEIPTERIGQVGNAAGMGTVASLFTKDALIRLPQVARDIEHVELGERSEFTDFFTDAMVFGES